MVDDIIRKSEKDWHESGDVNSALRLAQNRRRAGDCAGAHQLLAHLLCEKHPASAVVDLYHEFFPIHIDRLEDRWRMCYFAPSEGLFIEDEVARYLLGEGNSSHPPGYNQEECIKRLGEGWRLPSLREYWDLFNVLFLNRFHPDENQMNLIKEMKDKLVADCKKSTMMTGSAVLWRPKPQKDLFIPHYDYSKDDTEQTGIEYDLTGGYQVIGPGENIEDKLEITHGVSDSLLVRMTNYQIDPTNYHLYWNLKEKPSQEVKSEVVFGTTLFKIWLGITRFTIDLYSEHDKKGSARGIRRRNVDTQLPIP